METVPVTAPAEVPIAPGNIPRLYLFIARSNFVLWVPIWVVFLERRGLSLSQIGLLDTVAFALLAISEVPTGTVADVWGRKISMALGALLHGIAVLGILTAVLSPFFLVAYAIWGISFSFITGAGEAFAYDTLKADDRVDAYPQVASRHAMLQQAARGISGVTGGLVAAYDLRLCFVLTAVCCFASAGVILTGQEPPSSDGDDRPAPATGTPCGGGSGLPRASDGCA
jgi:MFS family permease